MFGGIALLTPNDVFNTPKDVDVNGMDKLKAAKQRGNKVQPIVDADATAALALLRAKSSPRQHGACFRECGTIPNNIQMKGKKRECGTIPNNKQTTTKKKGMWNDSQ